MAGPEETERVTGYPPGGVCPFGLEGVSIWIDESLAAWDTVYPAAGNDATGVPTSFEGLLAITGGRRAAVVD
jgi:prolyl-tRNA editing enzyme YbaK/EbsC (Cys-tRNA(Pro) deacylase)